MRAKRTVVYLRNGAPALQLSKLVSCPVKNRLSASVAKFAELKTVVGWIKKGLVAGRF